MDNNIIKGGNKLSTVIGVFDDQNQAERAVNEIKKAGITNDKISIVAKEDQVQNKDTHNQGENDDNNYLNQNLTTGTTTGSALGGLAGILGGAGALAIPGVGPILAAGPIAAGLTGAVTGGLTGGLVDLGVPKQRGEYYEEEVKKGGILATVETDQNQINDVASYMRRSGARDVETH